jgi:hypothetical protein
MFGVISEKAKQSRYTPWRRLGGEEIYLLLILDLGSRCGWVVSVTPRPRFSPGERTPGTHCTGGWVGLRAGLDTEARGRILCLCRGSNPDRPVVQPVARHCTDWTIRCNKYFWELFLKMFGRNPGWGIASSPMHDKTIADIEQLPERIRNQDGTAGAVGLIHSWDGGTPGWCLDLLIVPIIQGVLSPGVNRGRRVTLTIHLI